MFFIMSSTTDELLPPSLTSLNYSKLSPSSTPNKSFPYCSGKSLISNTFGSPYPLLNMYVSTGTCFTEN
jgi:hypothetical protein